MTRFFMAFFVVSLLLLPFGQAFASHPLITDDAGTQGKGNSQLEVNGEYDHDRDSGVTQKTFQAAMTLTYGLMDPLDISIGLPYLHVKTEDSGVMSDDGISDISIDMKWRFYEKDGLSLALKPGVTLPTGDSDKGFGAGRMGYHLFLIATEEVKPCAFHLNLGYLLNKNGFDERKDLWHASLAATAEVAKDLKLVANIGIQSNTAKDTNNHPAFVLGGLIYSLSETVDIDCGLKGGLTGPETDWSALAGMTWRF